MRVLRRGRRSTSDINYQLEALQATNATQIKGDTIHHALHIGRGARFTSSDDTAAGSQGKLAKRMLLWRWFIIDEISMVSVRFLAEIDMRLRPAMRGIGTMKQDAHLNERPFGGLNVVLGGDFWQLDPPEQNGWSLSRIPGDLYGGVTKCKPAATAEYGLWLMWSPDPKEGLHGVTELRKSERCKDVWYNEVLDECRDDHPSANN